MKRWRDDSVGKNACQTRMKTQVQIPRIHIKVRHMLQAFVILVFSREMGGGSPGGFQAASLAYVTEKLQQETLSQTRYKVTTATQGCLLKPKCVCPRSHLRTQAFTCAHPMQMHCSQMHTHRDIHIHIDTPPKQMISL